MTVFAVTDVRAVLPDRVLDHATVVVEDGVIAAVSERGAAPPHAIDGRGAFCLPGLVDTHSDGLEKELRPRPGVVLDTDFALRSYEGRVRAAGVTTMYHGIGFENGEKYQRSVQLANELCDAIERRACSADAIVDHRILYRLDARDADGFVSLQERLARRLDDGALPLVSFEDHTPGQGQYTDRTAFERYIRGTQGLSDDEARRRVDELIAERDQLLVNRARALPWLTRAAGAGHLRLMAHDPTTTDEVEEAVSWNAAIGEFPTTVEAARLARERGLRTVCGAPNVLRGGSHSGNVSAADLISLGLCDGLASDYLPSTLLGAVAVLVHDGACALPDALALVTSGPADTAGLRDRGRLVAGCRGDLVLASFDGRLPTVRAVLRAADHLEDTWTSNRSPALTT
ncbi:alpha-D-ribose 1-methylphosphonate 5-triphosphate diphosphatase [soil metagenome]